MKTKTTKRKRTPIQLRKREGALLSELCANHGYMFMDSLPEAQRSTSIFTRGPKRTRIDPAVVVKLAVRSDGALGRKILELRKGEPKKAKRRAGQRMRPLSKIGPGPSRP